MTIYEKLSTIQQRFKSKKSRFNSFGKYNFRSAEDILEATKPFLKELNCAIIISEDLLEGTNDLPIIESTATLYDERGMTISACALVGVDLKQKGMQMPQRFGSASSYGKKYALGNLFLIDDTQDSDVTNKHGKDPVLKLSKTNITGRQLAQAKDYVKSGGTIEAIKKKYHLTPALEQELKTL